MRFRIQIINYNQQDTYTVSYNPTKSTTKNIPSDYSEVLSEEGIRVVDMAGDLSVRLNADYTVSVEPVGELTSTSKSRYYLTIVIRQNASEEYVSAAVEEYSLFLGREDSKKAEF